MEDKTLIQILTITTIISLGITFILLVVFSPALIELKSRNTINHYKELNKDQNLTIAIAQVCSLYTSNVSQIACVNGIVKDTELYNYAPKDEFVLADSLKTEGADCESWTILYMATYELMGFNVEEIYFQGKHIYLAVDFGDGYCNVDQEKIDCHMYDMELVNSIIEETNATDI